MVTRLFWSLDAELWQMTHIVTLSTRVLPCWYSEPTWHFRHAPVSAISRRWGLLARMPLEPTSPLLDRSRHAHEHQQGTADWERAGCSRSPQARGPATCPTRATTPRVPAGTPASTGMVVVATVPEQTVLVVVRLVVACLAGRAGLAQHVVIALHVAAQHAQPCPRRWCSARTGRSPARLRSPSCCTG